MSRQLHCCIHYSDLQDMLVDKSVVNNGTVKEQFSLSFVIRYQLISYQLLRSWHGSVVCVVVMFGGVEA